MTLKIPAKVTNMPLPRDTRRWTGGHTKTSPGRREQRFAPTGRRNCSTRLARLALHDGARNRPCLFLGLMAELGSAAARSPAKLTERGQRIVVPYA
jgi:hypothetical protein